MCMRACGSTTSVMDREPCPGWTGERGTLETGWMGCRMGMGSTSGLSVELTMHRFATLLPYNVNTLKVIT